METGLDFSRGAGFSRFVKFGGLAAVGAGLRHGYLWCFAERLRSHPPTDPVLPTFSRLQLTASQPSAAGRQDRACSVILADLPLLVGWGVLILGVLAPPVTAPLHKGVEF